MKGGKKQERRTKKGWWRRETRDFVVDTLPYWLSAEDSAVFHGHGPPQM